jgi:hypothetical protein
MSRTHSFSVEVAKEYGVNVANMLNHFSFWYLKNKADNVNFLKGDYWVRMKAKQMQQYYPYFTERQLRHLIDKMIDLKLLKQDEFNDKKNDRTKWYCLSKKSKNILAISTDKNVSNIKKEAKKPTDISTDKNVSNVTHKIVSLTDKNVSSIYKEVDIKDRYYYYKEKIAANKSLIEILAMQNKVKPITIKNKIEEFVLHCKSVKKSHDNDGDVFEHFSSWIRKFDLKDLDLDSELNWFIKIFNKISRRDFKITEETRTRFAKQFQVGYSSADFKTAIVNLYNSSPENKFHLQHKFKFATPEYLLKDDNMNKYLNFKI